ncbi:hypothetical protein [Aquimarina aquimarini]|uniref:hypothetical protein n=1 Tax=Aquimarina aquimarini TaxID=1191734 RepID=UPI000D54D83A|nr:hypothetical protein [Aquimarina aquimarini]
MSIFPKRAIPGKTVTIHWNFNISSLKNTHILPFVRIGVKDPKGKVTMLFEEHVLGLPDPIANDKSDEQQLKYLNKNIPLLVLADYLSGPCKREKLIEILKNIQSGRHYYFTYTVPDDAPIGKYTLISEVHNSGEIKHSKTAMDDFFLVEKLTLDKVVEEGGQKKAIIINHSTEKTPVKVVHCYENELGELNTKVQVFEIEASQETEIQFFSDKDFLLYNEEREVIPLTALSTSYLLRNQQVLEIQKNNEFSCLLKRDKEEAYRLTTETKQLWEKSNGLFHKDMMSEKEKAIFEEMNSEGLIEEIHL